MREDDEMGSFLLFVAVVSFSLAAIRSLAISMDLLRVAFLPKGVNKGGG